MADVSDGGVRDSSSSHQRGVVSACRTMLGDRFVPPPESSRPWVTEIISPARGSHLRLLCPRTSSSVPLFVVMSCEHCIETSPIATFAQTPLGLSHFPLRSPGLDALPL